jgi:hypothetical protein
VGAWGAVMRVRVRDAELVDTGRWGQKLTELGAHPLPVGSERSGSHV